MNTRWLGIIFMTSTFVLLLNSYRQHPEVGDTLDSIAYLIWGLGGVCGMLGLITLNALGSSPIARALGFLPLFGFAMFVLTECLHLGGIIELKSTAYIVLASIAWIAMLAGMLAVGIITIAAKTWLGWRRFVPLLTIIMHPVGEGIGSALGIGSIIAYAFWLLLGYVITTAEPALVQQPSTAV